MRQVHPIAQEKWVVRLGREGVTPVNRRESPKRGRVDQLFLDLVSFPELVAHPNFTLARPQPFICTLFPIRESGKLPDPIRGTPP